MESKYIYTVIILSVLPIIGLSLSWYEVIPFELLWLFLPGVEPVFGLLVISLIGLVTFLFKNLMIYNSERRLKKITKGIDRLKKAGLDGSKAGNNLKETLLKMKNGKQ
jgi:hypothetical protein